MTCGLSWNTRMQIKPKFVVVDRISYMVHYICSKKMPDATYDTNLCFTEVICLPKVPKSTTSDTDPMFMSLFGGFVEET